MYLSGEKLFAYNSMQITINNFLIFMRDKQNFSISQEQEQEIKDNFFKPAQCLVYWSFINEDNDRVYNGTITKEFYIYIRTINPYDCYVIDDDVEYTIEDITFIEDPELIFYYLNSPNKNDDNLEESIKRGSSVE